MINPIKAKDRLRNKLKLLETGSMFYINLSNGERLTISSIFGITKDGITSIKVLGILPDGESICSKPTDTLEFIVDRFDLALKTYYGLNAEDIHSLSDFMKI